MLLTGGLGTLSLFLGGVLGQEMATHPQDTHHFTALPKAGESKLTGPGQEKKSFAQSWVLKQEILGARNEDKTDTSDGNLPALEALELMSVVEVKERLRARPSGGARCPTSSPGASGAPTAGSSPRSWSWERCSLRMLSASPALPASIRVSCSTR